MSSSEALADRLSTALLISAGFVILAGVVGGAVTAGAALPVLVDDSGGGGDETQVDPASIEGERDLSAFEQQLARRLEGQIQSGAINLSDGEYAAVRDQFNSSEYGGLIDSYRSVSSSSGGGGGDGGDTAEQVDDLTRLRRSLTDYSRYAEEYWLVYTEYQAARFANGLRGDTDREFTLARRLLRLERQANASGERALSTFRSLEETQRLNVSGAVEGVRTDMRNISRTQASVNEQSFAATELTVTPVSTDIAFDEPLELLGTLETADGLVLGNESATIAVGNRTYDVRTDGAGRFSVRYRPISLPLGRQSLSVAYRPNETSPYLGAETTVNVNVTQADSAVSVTASPDSVTYGDTLEVTGSIAAGNVTADEIPVRVEFGGVWLGDVWTSENGTYVVTGSVPDDMAVGEQPVRARVPLDDRAVSDAEGETSVEVRERGTSLSMSTSLVDERVVRVTGTMQFDDGIGAPNRSVVIAMAGETVATATTGADGAFETSFVVPESVESGAATNVTARFDAAGSNLQSATAGATVTVSDSGLPLWTLGGGLVVAVLIGLVFAWYRRTNERADTVEPADSGSDIGRNPSPEGNPELATRELLAASRESLDRGNPERAVRLAYAGVRTSLDGPRDATHWEFYRECAANGYPTEVVEALRELTEGYERASYTTGSTSVTDGERLVSVASSVAGDTRDR